MSSKVETSVAQGLPEWQTAMQGGASICNQPQQGPSQPIRISAAVGSRSRSKRTLVTSMLVGVGNGMLLHSDVDVPNVGELRLSSRFNKE